MQAPYTSASYFFQIPSVLFLNAVFDVLQQIVGASNLSVGIYRRPRPRPRPRPLPAPGAADGLGTTDFLGVSSTSRASRFRLSGSSHDLIVEPRTESVEYETGFFPRLRKRCEGEVRQDTHERPT